VDDDGDGQTDYEDPACCTQTAAMQVKKVLIVPWAGGRTAQNTTRTRRVRARKCQPPRRQVGARARLASPPCGTSGPEERWRGSEIGTTGNAKT